MNILELFKPDPPISIKPGNGKTAALNLPKTSCLNSTPSYSFLNLLSSIVKSPPKIDLPNSAQSPASEPAKSAPTQSSEPAKSPIQQQSTAELGKSLS